MAASSSAVDPNTQRKHHKKVEDYEERPKYRKGRIEKAVKVRGCLCCMLSRVIRRACYDSTGVHREHGEQISSHHERSHPGRY